ncbi:TetR/AcrR family transcriptional regulator [Nocardioides mangrovi]|uniref:TetR/AcrR family transcriptional regulator n=1 Tax=Nocardioides mangrovi TaxID=2874580 RepID=A0ABS7UHE7_9ACTN|nr:TetR/AcrR family transcriptional regulator [Nocardioides mangrovi]MBZ5740463.1 TetR/AcrR family transcriptional regulator [Nocardioides mangrovi]
MGSRTDTRSRMIASAALLLREHGVAGTTVARVLDHCRGPRGSVGFHFPGGRSQLLTEALGWVGALVSGQLRQGVDVGVAPDVLFRGICEHYRTQLEESGYTAACPVWAVAQEAYDDPDLGPVVAQVLDDWITLLARALGDAGHDNASATDTATLCIATLEGAITMARIRRTTRPITLAYEAMAPRLARPRA